jgi:hypothetical protein
MQDVGPQRVWPALEIKLRDAAECPQRRTA